MTINTTVNRKSYAGNGATTAFSYPYRFLKDADLVVLLVDDTTGVETTQVLTTNYTLTGAGGPSGGTVTMLVAPPVGKTLVIYRDPVLTQDVDLVENDSLPVDTAVEEPLDKLTMISQRNRELWERALRLPEGDTGFAASDLELPPKVTRASTLLGFDIDGKPIASAGIGGVSTSPFMATLLDDIDAITARATLGVILGTDVQAYNAELAAIAGLTSAADRLPYFTGSGTAALATLTAAGRTLLAGANAAAQRTTLVVPGLTTANVFTISGRYTGDPSLNISPTANTPTTDVTFSVQASDTTTDIRQFLVHFGLDRDSAGSTKDKVTLYAGLRAQAGAGDVWSFNTVLTQELGSGDYNAHGYELDFNNLVAHRGELDGGAGLAAPVSYGLGITGAGTFRSTAAVYISGPSGAGNELWNRGIAFVNLSVKQACVQDLTDADISLDIRGTHTYGLDLKNMTGTPIRIANNAKIMARNNADSADVILAKLSTTDDVWVAPSLAAGDVLFLASSAADSDPVYLRVGGANFQITAGANDGESAGYRILRVANV